MARFRSDQDYPITVNDLCRVVGPREEFDWPGYDPAVHGVIPGCTWLDEPQKPAGEPSGGQDADRSGHGDAPAGKDAAPASGAPAAGDSEPNSTPAPGGAASKENQA